MHLSICLPLPFRFVGLSVCAVHCYVRLRVPLCTEKLHCYRESRFAVMHDSIKTSVNVRALK